jgi:phosphatidylserine/phosphatidylglycerophosphate/cardiolipin synthase-like enzyme
VLSFIIAVLGLYPFLTATILLFGILLWKYTRGMNARLHLKVVSSDFIHEKLYISDTIAITGSANLTYSGMHRNIESINITKNLEEVERLKKHFDRLWQTYREQ